MELLMAIALLCQISPSTGSAHVTYSPYQVAQYQLECQKSFLNCTSNSRSKTNEKDALEKCVLEK